MAALSAALLALALQAAPADAAGQAGEAAVITCAGEHRQGALLVCRTLPGAAVSLGDATARADADGFVVLGHDRDAAAETVLAVEAEGVDYAEPVTVAARDYQIQRIEGVPPQYVSPPEAVIPRIREEAARKREAYASDWAGAGFAQGFVLPLEGRVTGVYGSQRFYNGEPRRPHYGIDIAAPGGAPVRAPAGGVVTLADPDMYFEGGLVFIDHGQGLTSAFLHLGSVDVAVGEVVEKGQVIGGVGSGGRSTGAHLDWRIKWRDRYIDPESSLALDLEALR